MGVFNSVRNVVKLKWKEVNTIQHCMLIHRSKILIRERRTHLSVGVPCLHDRFCANKNNSIFRQYYRKITLYQPNQKTPQDCNMY